MLKKQSERRGGCPPRLETQHRDTDCGLMVTLMVVVEEGREMEIGWLAGWLAGRL